MDGDTGVGQTVLAAAIVAALRADGIRAAAALERSNRETIAALGGVEVTGLPAERLAAEDLARRAPACGRNAGWTADSGT